MTAFFFGIGLFAALIGVGLLALAALPHPDPPAGQAERDERKADDRRVNGVGLVLLGVGGAMALASLAARMLP